MDGSRNWLSVVAVLLIGGCTAPRPKLVVTDPDPAVKIPAMKLAVDQNNHEAEAQLVKDLSNDDPAVRLYAVEALRRLTGQSFGYEYYKDADAREPAVKRWKAWLAQRHP